MAKAAAATGTLRVAGVAGYEGGYEPGYEPGHGPGYEQSISAGSQEDALGLIAAFCGRLRGLAETLVDRSAPGRIHRHGRRQRVFRRGDLRADGGRHRRDAR